MFARRIRIEYEEGDRYLACPLKWLDNFAMRNFTNATVFDDTLPVSDGLMEVGMRVPLLELEEQMQDWFQRKCYIAKPAHLKISEL